MYYKTILRSIQKGLETDKAAWENKKVLVVGAGIAGLCAGEILAKSGINFEVLEASNTFGGRVRSLENFADIPLELGAEWIHGKYSVWYDLIESLNIGTRKDEEGLESYYQIENILKKDLQLEDVESFRTIEDVYESLESYQGEALSVKKYLDNIDLAEGYRHILETWLESEYGTNCSELDLKSLAEAMRSWSSGIENYKAERVSFHTVLEKAFANALSKTVFAQVVVKVNYTSERVIVSTESGQKLEVDKVILTVPLTILKQGLIEFEPKLPQKKQEAIQSIGMDRAGIKLILKFKDKFWNSDTYALYTKGLLPEFYTHPQSQEAVLTAYIMGKKAEYLSQNQHEILDLTLSTLGQFYDKATKDNLLGYYIMDWSEENFVQGAYSYPSPNSTQSRKILAQTVAQKIFFAGEATNVKGHFATVHGAMESGFRAVEQMLNLS